MTYIRRMILALALSAGLAPAFAQVPPPVPALPDTERRTSYSISASTCACNVGFALYGDSNDVANWIEVFVNGVRMAQAGNWTLSSVTGTIGSIPLPITNAVLTFTAPQTGTIQIVGARRPRRTSQFNEGAGVPTRNFNVVLSDLTAQNRELWDKTNDVTGRALLSQPGNTLSMLPLPSACAGKFLGFDITGLIPQCFSGSGSGNVTGPVSSTVGNIPTFANTTGSLLQDSGITVKSHLVVYTVAPSGASVADKLKADFIGDGTNDQTAVNAAVTAARAVSSYSKVVMLPGRYTFSGPASLGGAPGENGFVFEARGTFINGPGVGGAATALDTFVIQNSNFSEFNFGSILTKNTGTAAAIHSTGNYSETKITWQALDGTARGGYGFFADTTSAATSQSVNWITATHVQNFAKGIVLSSVGAGANIDTWRITVDYVFNNAVGIYVHAATGGGVNSNFWNINIDASNTAADIAFETNSSFDVVNGIIGGLAAGSHNIVLDAGATANIFNLTPISLAVAAGSILDNSANLTNLINGSSIDGFLNGSAQLVKYDGATNGALNRTGLTLGAIGTINTLAWFPSSGALSSLTTANSSILVTSSGGVPSWSTTLPPFGLASASTINWNSDTFIGRAAAANFKLGQADAAAPVAQTLSVQNVVTGTSNTAGALTSIAGSQGTGTGLGGALSFKISPPGGSGSTPNALVEVARLAPTAAGGSVWTQGAGLPFTPGTGVIAEWRTGTDQRFALGPKNLLTTGVAFQVYNDAIAANVGLEFRASLYGFTIGGVCIQNAACTDPGSGNLNVGGTIASTVLKVTGSVPVGTTGSCVASSFVGGSTAGKFSAAVCAAGTIILSSLPTAANGYTCNAQDQTTPANTLKQTANTNSSVTFTSTTTAADVVVFQCMAW